jgi:hypothetical protein
VPLSAAAALEPALKLLNYCQSEGWAGYDPYDALNSPLLAAIPGLNSRFARIFLTQALKRSPINVRPLLGIPRLQNPKALGLFLSALLRLQRAGCADTDEATKTIVRRLRELRSPGAKHWCWGYSFPWQTRTVCAARHAPNLVCTTFVANALLEYHERTGDAAALEMALDAAEYIEGLFWKDSNACSFSYPVPNSRSQVHNANLMAAALLCRASRISGREPLAETGLKAARYSVSRQNANGSWFYGEARSQRWIDNFHTGFNLCALEDLAGFYPKAEFSDSLERGYQFYIQHFFRADGAAKYFHDRTYPIDTHSVAQSVITLVRLGRLSPRSPALAASVLAWALANLWDDRGYFHHQKSWWGNVRIPYMRWGQAWMLLALAVLLEDGRPHSDGKPLEQACCPPVTTG